MREVAFRLHVKHYYLLYIDDLRTVSPFIEYQLPERVVLDPLG